MGSAYGLSHIFRILQKRTAKLYHISRFPLSMQQQALELKISLCLFSNISKAYNCSSSGLPYISCMPYNQRPFFVCCNISRTNASLDQYTTLVVSYYISHKYTFLNFCPAQTSGIWILQSSGRPFPTQIFAEWKAHQRDICILFVVTNKSLALWLSPWVDRQFVLNWSLWKASKIETHQTVPFKWIF